RTLANETDLVGRLQDSLGARFGGVFSETHQHVPRSTVVAAAAAAREAGADILVSFGGGSPVDTTKLVSLCLAADITDESELGAYHFREEPDGLVFPELPPVTTPHIAVSTTLSAGEYTLWAGATDTSRGVKDAYATGEFVPKLVILDPELTVATPGWLWGSTGMKAFDHAVETICSTVQIPFANALARGAVEILTENLVSSSKDPNDVAGRGLCQMAAWMSIFSLPSVAAGLSHALGHQLGAHCDVPHGVTSAILLPKVMEFNSSVNAAQQRLVAEAMGIQTAGLDDAAAAQAAADKLREIVSQLDVNTALREWNVSDEDMAAIGQDSLEDFMALTNPRKIETAVEVEDLLKSLY
ncbi:MAG: iron-containing alcohol dehydrogenase, partial [Solirubrobacterales bacterium]